MHRFGPDTVIAQYRVKAGSEPAFERLLEKHWPTLDRLGLTNGEPSLVFRGKERAGGSLFVEVFTWKDAKAPDAAHTNPEVGAIWGAMEPLVEARGGREKWEFPHVAPVAMPFSSPLPRRT